MNETTAWRYLTWICAIVALLAILAFAFQSWQLILFGLGVSVVLGFVVRQVRMRLAVHDRQ